MNKSELSIEKVNMVCFLCLLLAWIRLIRLPVNCYMHVYYVWAFVSFHTVLKVFGRSYNHRASISFKLPEFCLFETYIKSENARLI